MIPFSRRLIVFLLLATLLLLSTTNAHRSRTSLARLRQCRKEVLGIIFGICGKKCDEKVFPLAELVYCGRWSDPEERILDICCPEDHTLE